AAAAAAANSVCDAASDAGFSAAASTQDEPAVGAATSAALPHLPPPPPPPPARAPSLESSTVQHEAKLTWLLYTLSDPLVKMFLRLRQFLMGASYILTLVSMMAWSVTYVSFCTLPFLLLSCLLWLSPGTRRFTLGLSPLLVVYSTGLLLANYAFNFNLPEIYLARRNQSSFAQIGLQVYEAPMLTFAAQLTFCCVFYFTLWTFLSERRQGVSHDTRAALELYHLRGHSLHRRRRKTMETLIIEVMSKYSLIICCTFWVLMCSRSVVNISHIIVMAIFLYFIITFRLFYGFWRRQLIVCFWGIMLYSMLTLLLIYAYQFQSVPEFITRLTGIQPATLKEIGIEKYETPQLFLNLLFPTSFIIVIMIHVKNFHKTFLQLSNMQPDLDPSATEQPIQQLQPAPPSSIERPIEVDVEMTAAAGRESEIEDDFEDPRPRPPAAAQLASGQAEPSTPRLLRCG
uniref:Piezo-type mechanosensitive ion channel component n=1 Tax=Macrostomum lignano TaxID=282301 RepID=A0A1I8IUL1_9PLAT